MRSLFRHSPGERRYTLRGALQKNKILNQAHKFLFSDKNAAFIPGLPALGFLQLGFRVQPFIENKFHIV